MGENKERDSFTFKSNNGQYYLYNPFVNRIFLIHPILNFIYNFEKKDSEIKKWINSLNEEVCIDNYGYVSQNELVFYYEKYLFFKKNNLLEGYKIKEKYNKKVTEDDIKYAFANVNAISFEVTGKCNLNCKYCTYSDLYTHSDGRGSENCDIDLAKKMLTYFNDFRYTNYSYSKHKNYSIGFYGGETLLNMNFIKEIVQFAECIKKKDQEIVYNLTTNGIFIEKYIDFLIKYNIKLLISIDGNEVNNAFRTFDNGEPSYEIVKRNIDLIKEKHPSYFENNVTFNTVIHKKNSIKEIYTFFKDEGWKFPSLSEVSLFWINDDKKNEIRKIYKNMYEEISRKDFDSRIAKEMGALLPNIREMNILSKTFGGYEYNSYSDFFMNKKDGPFTPTGSCIPFSFKVFISVDGHLMACENTGTKNALDKLDKNNVKVNFKKVAGKYNNLLEKAKLTQCNSCYRIDNCTECMYMFLNEKTENNCKSFLNKKQFKKFLSDYISKLERMPDRYCRGLR